MGARAADRRLVDNGRLGEDACRGADFFLPFFIEKRGSGTLNLTAAAANHRIKVASSVAVCPG